MSACVNFTIFLSRISPLTKHVITELMIDNICELTRICILNVPSLITGRKSNLTILNKQLLQGKHLILNRYFH